MDTDRNPHTGSRPARLSRPAFLITIDTEGDNLWAAPREITTTNSKYLGRFQSLCERHRLKPTYVTDYEMAMCPVYREFALDVIRRDAGEIGMHLHAWNSPPLVALTGDDYRHQPYLMEYPEAVMREKIRVMTALLEERFQIAPRSHRAGRWGFDERYARMLAESGYRVDCSVSPKTSYKAQFGCPEGNGGPDYTRFPDLPYFLDLDDIGRPGNSDLLELPVTVMDFRPEWARNAPGFAGRVVNRLYPARARLRPSGANLPVLLRVIRRAAREKRPCAEFMLHSSELMPGGSPTFKTDADIERLYDDLEVLFAESTRLFRGATLAGFYAETVRQ